MSETNRYAVQITEPIGTGTGSTSSHVQGPFSDYQTAFDFGKEVVADTAAEFVVHKLVPVQHATDAEFNAAMANRNAA